MGLSAWRQLITPSTRTGERHVGPSAARPEGRTPWPSSDRRRSKKKKSRVREGRSREEMASRASIRRQSQADKSWSERKARRTSDGGHGGTRKIRQIARENAIHARPLHQSVLKSQFVSF